MSDDDEPHVLRNSESLAEVERDRLRARVAELEALVGADMEKAWRGELARVEMMANQRGRIQDLCHRTALPFAHFGVVGQYVLAADILEALEHDPTSVAASGPRTNETGPDVEASAADEWGPDDIFDLPSLGKVVGEWVCLTRARHDAEQAVVEAAKAFRHWCRPSSHMSPPAQALIAAVDALSTSQRDRQEATCPRCGGLDGTHTVRNCGTD
jgi:hypothetical protein